MERLNEGDSSKTEGLRGKATLLNRYRIITIVLAIVLVVCIVAICVAIPLLANEIHKNPDAVGSTTQPSSQSLVCGSTVDLIIVGGGCGGTYSGWRLKTNEYSNKSIMIVEATNRIGGRLLSFDVDHVTYTAAELGGMRFYPKSHPKLKAVIDELQIQTKEFAMDEDNGERPYSFRDVVIQQKDLLTAKNLPFFLLSNETGIYPEDIQVTYFNLTVPPSERNKPNDQLMTIYNEPLYKYGPRNAFNLGGSSQDALTYYELSTGYSDAIHNLNAAWLMSGSTSSGPVEDSDDLFQTVTDGMQTVPKSLFAAFKAAGGQYMMGTTVYAVEKIDETYYVRARFTANQSEVTLCAREAVIMSLTRRQLQWIDWIGFRKSQYAKYLDAVFSDIAVKIFLTFREPFWTKPELKHFNITKGRTVSGSPTRNTYYFTPPPDNKNDDGLLMLYGDGQHAMFWGALANNEFPSYAGPTTYWPVSEPIVEQALRLLAINHNTTREVIGTPSLALMQYWSAETALRVTGDGTGEFDIRYPSEPWHVWRAGYNYTEVSPLIVKLDPNQNVYVIGEAYSLNQGWVEGALETADLMLDRYFGISPIAGRVRSFRPWVIP